MIRNWKIPVDSIERTGLRALYHEYMYYIDNVMYETKVFDADRWIGLNPPGVGYSYSGAMEMIQPHPEPGFLNGYSMADVYQDKAEVFSCLLIPS